ncbi:MAG: ATP-binding cassette domain-containing protein [Caldilineaceae bacterium]
MQPLLSLQNVFYTHGDGTEALSNISVTVNRHELFVLFGPACSGKSTLLRLLNRLSDLDEWSWLAGPNPL